MESRKICFVVWWIFLLGHVEGTARSKKFSHTAVSTAKLENSIEKTEKFNVAKETFCAAIAMRLQWPNLACYKDNVCTLSSYESLPFQEIPAEDVPVQCATVFEEEGKF